MANYRAANVIVVDTSAQFAESCIISAIKYIGAASGTASIKQDSSSGSVVWEASGAANTFDSEIDLVSKGGIYVTVGSGAKVYIYLE